MALTPQVMGIVNVTPDSFYAASRTTLPHDAIALGLEMFRLGANVVDVGGESTRPGARGVEVEEERARVLPVVTALARAGRVSVDTQKPAVARDAVAAGATIVNDVTGTLVDLAGELGVSYVAMHRLGDSATMQDDPQYGDVVQEVCDYLFSLAVRARDGGVKDLWLDPGIGFGKTVQHNLALIAHVDRFVQLAETFHAGVLLGTSRKRFLSHLGTQPLAAEERLEGSLATQAWAYLHGATMVRVHDVKSAVQLRELVVRQTEEVIA